MKRLKLLTIPLSVVLNAVLWKFAADSNNQTTALTLWLAVSALLTVVSLWLALPFFASLKLKVAGAVAAGAVALAIVGVVTGIDFIMYGGITAGIISICGTAYALARMWHKNSKKSFRVCAYITAGIICAVCIFVAVSAVKMMIGPSSGGAMFSFAIFCGLMAPTVALLLTTLLTSVAFGRGKPVKHLKKGLGFVLSLILFLSLLAAVTDGIKEPHVSVAAQGAALYMGASEEEHLCIYSKDDGTRIYLVNENNAMSFRESFELGSGDFYTRKVDGTLCRLKTKSYAGLFELHIYTPIE